MSMKITEAMSQLSIKLTQPKASQSDDYWKKLYELSGYFTTGLPMRPAFRLVPDFIVPHLNRSTYGNHLQWEDKTNGSFKISRIHQSSEMWNEECIEVYKAWSMKKKLWKIDDPKRITKAKHRLITALRRNPEIEMLDKESTFYRFRIVQQNNSDERRCEEKTNEESPTEYVNETAENTKISDHCDMKNVREISKVNIDSSLFGNPKEFNPFSLSEFYDSTPTMFPMSDIFNDELYPNDAKSTDSSDRCCCEVLLDNFLCNQKCIWHGMPP